MFDATVVALNKILLLPSTYIGSLQAIQNLSLAIPNGVLAILLCCHGHCLGDGFEGICDSDWLEEKTFWMTLVVDILPCTIDINKQQADLKSLAQALLIAHDQMMVGEL